MAAAAPIEMKFEEPSTQREWDTSKDCHDLSGCMDAARSDAALDALLGGAGDGAHDAERRAQRLGRRLQRLDALNVGGVLGAATEGGGAELARALDAALAGAAALAARHARCDTLARGAPDAVTARSGAARADAHARALLAELHAVFAWLDPPPLRDLDALPEIPLTSAEGRARALEACEALLAALQGEREAPAHVLRLAAVRERLRRLARAGEQTTAAVARHVNNVLIHLGNEAAAGGAAEGRHRGELLPLAPFMRWLRDMDAAAFESLTRVYTAWRARALERELRAACDAARAELTPAAPPDRADELLDSVLGAAEALCDAEQDFCERFFSLEAEGGAEGATRARAAESRRLMAALFPALEPALLSLTQHVERHDQYGAFRVLACIGRRVLAESAGGAEARWARAALAGAAVAAKRQADRAVHERVARMHEGVRAAARRSKCGVLPFVEEFEELTAACERIFSGGRRADVERWYLSLASACVRAVEGAEHPRTPRAALLLENHHRLHAALSALRAAPLEPLRRELRARYEEALRAYVAQCGARPLERVAQFFDGVAEAVAAGCPEAEVRYRAAFGKQAVRRALAASTAAEERRALHRLYRTVDKQLAGGALLQVVWRALQERVLREHGALQQRLAACYPGADLALPLSTQDILDAFSDIARDH